MRQMNFVKRQDFTQAKVDPEQDLEVSDNKPFASDSD